MKDAGKRHEGHHGEMLTPLPASPGPALRVGSCELCRVSSVLLRCMPRSPFRTEGSVPFTCQNAAGLQHPAGIVLAEERRLLMDMPASQRQPVSGE